MFIYNFCVYATGSFVQKAGTEAIASQQSGFGVNVQNRPQSPVMIRGLDWTKVSNPKTEIS